MTIECVKVERNPRMAECTHCGRLQPSDQREHLAFFIDCSAGSPVAMRSCKHCSYYKEAHEMTEPIPRYLPQLCGHFEAVGAFDRDRYYCGCSGWN